MPETGLTLLQNIGVTLHQPTDYLGQFTELVQQLGQLHDPVEPCTSPATAFEALFAELPTVEF
ncbi:hypothetical protein CUZ56_00843 [Saezia sanguinis]|uniref:Uncharacterized protein n=1 Tax=Saezia sanguinis TaxID=1965230 RepID=A0A433SHY8_9BURK|nr:hypothetical protein CUZ56_00843 [Saezia sanguinis]